MNTSITLHAISTEDFDKILREYKIREEESIIEKYYGVIIPTSMVALIHDVNPSTVCRYVQRGLIPIVERSSSKGNYKFRLSEILKLDFTKLRKLI